MIEDFKAATLLIIIIPIFVILTLLGMIYLGVIHTEANLIERMILILICVYLAFRIMKSKITFIRKYAYKIILSDNSIESVLLLKRKTTVLWADVDKITESIPGGGSTKVIKIQSHENKIYISDLHFGEEYEVIKDRLKIKAKEFNKNFDELGKTKTSFNF